MRYPIMATALAALSLASPTPAQTQPPPIASERFGLYVVSDDLDRSAAFYEKLFGKPQFRLPGLVGYDVAGGLYAVVDRQRYAASAARGDTTRGYVKVRDIHAAYGVYIDAASAVTS